MLVETGAGDPNRYNSRRNFKTIPLFHALKSKLDL
jgi:hypothetical protein